jgi:hypothetical protein
VSPSTSPNSPPHNFAEYIIVVCKIIKGIYKKKKKPPASGEVRNVCSLSSGPPFIPAHWTPKAGSPPAQGSSPTPPLRLSRVVVFNSLSAAPSIYRSTYSQRLRATAPQQRSVPPDAISLQLRTPKVVRA